MSFSEMLTRFCEGEEKRETPDLKKGKGRMGRG
jgi:hypothetical protein